MESLRTQLTDTQTALTERDKKFRQLRADYIAEKNAWMQEKSALEAKVAQLESELKERNKWATPFGTSVFSQGSLIGSPKTPGPFGMTSPLSVAGDNSPGANEIVTIPRAQVAKAEADYTKVLSQLNEITNKCMTLEADALLSKSPLILELSESDVVARWNQLREKITTFTLVYLNKTFDPKVMTEICQRDITALSPHWKTYTNTEDLPCYLFRALIWRYILRYFDIFCRAYGRDVSRKLGDVANLLTKDRTEETFTAWRIRTANMVHKRYPIDQSLIQELTQKILESVAPMLGTKDVGSPQAILLDIVTKAADLSAILDRSNLFVLMQDQPGSSKLHSFPHAEWLMDIVWTLGSKEVVDLVVTPALLKKEATYSVLVKAEVSCG